jgi:hypothetical protein
LRRRRSSIPVGLRPNWRVSSRLDLVAGHHLTTNFAQPRFIAAQAGDDLADVGNEIAAQPEYVGLQACRSDMVPCATLALLPSVAATMAKLINSIDFRNICFLIWLTFSVTSLLNCFFGRKPHGRTPQKAPTSSLRSVLAQITS